jgi:hypothetical protein
MIIASTYRPGLASSTIQSFLGPACAAKDTVLEQSDLASEWAREEVRRAPRVLYLSLLSFGLGPAEGEAPARLGFHLAREAVGSGGMGSGS